MCWNLRGKQYHIQNQPYTKEAYFEELKKYNLGSWKTIQTLKEEWRALVQGYAVHRENLTLKITNSSGNYLTNCKQCVNCYYWEISEECYNCLRGLNNKSIIDCTGIWDVELGGNAAHSYRGYMMKSCVWSNRCRYCEYVDQCFDCEYCFGCVGLKNKRYCILNKQYSKEEYEALRERIIESMKKEGMYGDFFPYDLAYSGYNLSVAQIYFPKKKEEALAFGAAWEDVSDAHHEGMPTSELPDDIKDADENITAQPLICPETGYRFNIAPRELAFHREMNIPLPRVHPDARNLARFRQINVLTPNRYQCIFCKKDIIRLLKKPWINTRA